MPQHPALHKFSHPVCDRYEGSTKTDQNSRLHDRSLRAQNGPLCFQSLAGPDLKTNFQKILFPLFLDFLLRLAPNQVRVPSLLHHFLKRLLPQLNAHSISSFEKNHNYKKLLDHQDYTGGSHCQF